MFINIVPIKKQELNKTLSTTKTKKQKKRERERERNPFNRKKTPASTATNLA